VRRRGFVSLLGGASVRVSIVGAVHASDALRNVIARVRPCPRWKHLGAEPDSPDAGFDARSIWSRGDAPQPCPEEAGVEAGGQGTELQQDTLLLPS